MESGSHEDSGVSAGVRVHSLGSGRLPASRVLPLRCPLQLVSCPPHGCGEDPAMSVLNKTRYCPYLPPYLPSNSLSLTLKRHLKFKGKNNITLCFLLAEWMA